MSDKPMPQSGTLCYCPKCSQAGLDPLFRAWPATTFCPKHSGPKPRVRNVNGRWVYV